MPTESCFLRAEGARHSPAVGAAHTGRGGVGAIVPTLFAFAFANIIALPRVRDQIDFCQERRFSSMRERDVKV